jgi:hypothetical protein
MTDQQEIYYLKTMISASLATGIGPEAIAKALWDEGYRPMSEDERNKRTGKRYRLARTSMGIDLHACGAMVGIEAWRLSHIECGINYPLTDKELDSLAVLLGSKP